MFYEKSIFSTGVFMFIFGVGCKGLGFFRNTLLANCFGTSDVVDAYVLAQSIPNILVGGILLSFSVAYMPLFSKRYEMEGEEAANRYTSRIIISLFAFSLFITFLGVLFSREIVLIVGPDLNETTIGLASFYLKIAFGYSAFSSTVGIFTSYLEYKGFFKSQIFGNYIQNCFLIVFIWIGYINGSWLLIFGIFFGYFFRWIYLYTLARKNGFIFSVETNNYKQLIFEIGKYSFPVFLGTSAFEINAYVDWYLASRLGSGSISVLNYACQLNTVMIELTVVILATLLYPKMVKFVTTNEIGKFRECIYYGLDLCALITVPIAFGSVIYAHEIVSIVFERGAFVSRSTMMTSSAYAFYSIGVFFLALTTFLTKVYYSMGNMKVPMVCSMMGVVVNVAADFLLIDYMAVDGLALATSIASIVNALLLLIFLKRGDVAIQFLSRKSVYLKIILSAIISIGGGYMVYKICMRMMESILTAWFVIIVGITACMYIWLLRRIGVKDVIM